MNKCPICECPDMMQACPNCGFEINRSASRNKDKSPNGLLWFLASIGITYIICFLISESIIIKAE